MNAKYRLSRSLDIKRVQRQAKSHAGAYVVLLAAENSLDHSRIGVIASTATGNAVQRNSSRRRIKGCINDLFHQMKAGHDVLFIARRSLREATYTGLCDDMRRVIRRAGLWIEND